MTDEVPEVETISLDEYNEYAKAEEAEMLKNFSAEVKERAAHMDFARDLNDPVTTLDHARTQYWEQKMLEACGAGAGEMQYDKDGNPI